jgi:hypothetical protein
MKSITLHGIDTDLDQKISVKSKEYGLSQNKTVKLILQKTLQSDPGSNKRDDFSDLFGKWTEKEKCDFEARINDLETVDAADWKK